MRYEHTLTFDQDEQEKHFLFDNKAERTGLESACKLINGELNQALKGIVLENMTHVDKVLSEWYNTKVEESAEVGTNVVKAVSEAILLATASCYEMINVSKGISSNIFKDFPHKHHSKLMINILNGGKLLGSAVKFAKFSLIIDGSEDHEDITECFLKFSQNIRKTVQGTKQGVIYFNL